MATSHDEMALRLSIQCHLFQNLVKRSPVIFYLSSNRKWSTDLNFDVFNGLGLAAALESIRAEMVCTSGRAVKDAAQLPASPWITGSFIRGGLPESYAVIERDKKCICIPGSNELSNTKF